MRSVETIKKEIDNVAYYRDMILKHRLPSGEFNMDKISAQYSSLLSFEEQDSYSMVFGWIKNDNMENVFLQDANTLVLKPQMIVEIVSYLKKSLPSIKLVASYGRADTLVKISTEDFILMKEAGLNLIHSGYESGSDRVLQLLNKGCTQADQIEAAKRIKKAGIELNIYYMPGSGGKEFSDINAIETAQMISEANPDFVRIRTFVIKPQTPMWQMEQEGKFKDCTDLEKVIELKKMLANIKNADSYVLSDHIINLLPGIEGRIDKDRDKILSYIDGFLTLSEKERKIYQLARRMGFGGGYENMRFISQRDIKRVTSVVENVKNDDEWEAVLKKYLINYI